MWFVYVRFAFKIKYHFTNTKMKKHGKQRKKKGKLKENNEDMLSAPSSENRHYGGIRIEVPAIQNGRYWHSVCHRMHRQLSIGRDGASVYPRHISYMQKMQQIYLLLRIWNVAKEILRNEFLLHDSFVHISSSSLCRCLLARACHAVCVI